MNGYWMDYSTPTLFWKNALLYAKVHICTLIKFQLHEKSKGNLCYGPYCMTIFNKKSTLNANKFISHSKIASQTGGLRENSSRSVNANDRSWCFSAQFGFGCLDLAFLNNCWVKTLTGRKDTPTPVIGIRRPGATLRRALPRKLFTGNGEGSYRIVNIKTVTCKDFCCFAFLKPKISETFPLFLKNWYKFLWQPERSHF